MAEGERMGGNGEEQSMELTEMGLGEDDDDDGDCDDQSKYGVPLGGVATERGEIWSGKVGDGGCPLPSG